MKVPDKDDKSKAEEPGLPPVQAEPANHDVQQNADDQNSNDEDDEYLLNETPNEIMPLAEQADSRRGIKRKTCEPSAINYPKRTRRPPPHLNNYLCFHTSHGVGSIEDVPTIYKTVIECPESG